MNKILNHIGVALLAITLFSCADKNKWTTETEAEFKLGAKEGMLKKGKGMLSEDQIDYIVDCSVQKFKLLNIKPFDTQKPENSDMIKKAAKECAQEWLSSNQEKIGKSILAE